ncbi:thioester domain-containing protein [Prauserella oleivorans]
MHTTPGRVRVGAAVLGASAVLLTGALPAAADEATARIDTGAGTSGYRVDLGQGYGEMSTTLFTLDLDGGNSLRAYCVEIDVRIDPARGLSEQPWDGFPNPGSPFHDHRDKINWVLHHGYPAVDIESLEQTLAESGIEVRDGLSEREAITATQAAVWHFSDGKDINRDNPVPHAPEAADDVLGLYDYLTGEDNVGIGDQPAPALDVSPGELTGPRASGSARSRCRRPARSPASPASCPRVSR